MSLVLVAKLEAAGVEASLARAGAVVLRSAMGLAWFAASGADGGKAGIGQTSTVARRVE